MNSLPNLLTLSRIFMIPLLVGCFYLGGPLAHWLSLAVFLTASVTDFLDGFTARRMSQQSRLGQFMDPIADKILVAAALFMMVAFGWIDRFSLVAAIIILAREILVSGLREFLAEIDISVPVTKVAKWKTTAQMAAISFLLAGSAASPFPAREIGTVLLWGAALLTLYTGYDYLRRSMVHLKSRTGPEAGE